MNKLIALHQIIQILCSLRLLSPSLIRSVNPETYTFYCAENGRVGEFNSFCPNCWQIMSPCDFRLLAMARTPLGIRMGAPGTIVWDPLESAGGRIKQGQFTKWFFLHSVKYSITCASASSAGVGFIGELIFSKVSDIIFDEIQKLDPDLRNMPKLNIERMLNGVLSAQGFNELVTEIKKISLEEGIVEVVLRKSTRTASETFKEIGRRVVEEKLCIIS